MIDSPTGRDGHEGAPWRVRYFTVFAGQAVSMIGSATAQFVLMWWITDATGSISALGAAGMAALLPQALLAPIGGVFADRYSRRMLMIVADVASALCMIVLMWLFLTAQVALWHVYLTLFLRSAAQAFQGPAAAASVAMLVPSNFLPRAAGLNQLLFGATTVAAAPLGALAISLMPFGWALSIDVVTALAGIIPLLIFRIPQPPVPSEQRPNLWREFNEGVSLVWRDGGLSRLYLLLALLTMMLMPSFTLVPLLIRQHFGGGATEVAFLEALAGIGMILGGIIAALFAPKRAMVWVLSGLAVANLGVSLTGLAPSHAMHLAAACWALASVALMIGNTPVTLLLQTIVPNHMQGRAFSLLSTLLGVSTPIGLALAIPVGELLGVRWLFVSLGILGAVVCVAAASSRPLMRLDDRPTDGRA